MVGTASTIPRWRRTRFAIGAGLGLMLLQSCAGDGVDASPQDAAGTPSMQAPGAGLYARHCAACHGRDGSGEEAVSDLFNPRIRAFSSGEFHIVSTENGVPTDEDLIAVIANGMPGSAMPSFGWMSDPELTSLAEHVRGLAVEGLVPEIMSLALQRGEELTSEQVRELAVERLTPGPAIEIGEPVAPSPDVLALGRRLYVENCAACHGREGKGLKASTWPDLIEIQWARDLTAGILRGGGSHESIETRIRAGMPGATMPPTNVGPEGTAALVAYVHSLIPEGAAEKYVQRRSSIPVRRVGTIPSDPEDAQWNQQDETRIVLAPMWWREGAVTEAWIAGVHDGENIGLRLRWKDTTRNDRSLGNLRPDGAALQLSDGQDPPIFGMGAPDHTVNIWHWKAFTLDDIIGLSDFLEGRAHALGVTDVPIYRPAPGVVRPRERGEAMQVGGMDSVRDAVGRGDAILSLPSWVEDEWQLLFSQPMGSTDSGIGLSPGDHILVALGIWNGGAGDAGGQKSISIWHHLRIDP